MQCWEMLFISTVRVHDMHRNYYEGHALTFRLSGDVSRIADDTVHHTFLERSPASPPVLHIIPAFLHCADQICDIAAEEKVGRFAFLFFFSHFFLHSCLQRCNLLKSSSSAFIALIG